MKIFSFDSQLIQLSLAITAIVVAFLTLLTMVYLIVEFLKFKNSMSSNKRSTIGYATNSRDVECGSLFSVGYAGSEVTTFENPGYKEDTLIEIDPENYIFKQIIFGTNEPSSLDDTVKL